MGAERKLFFFAMVMGATVFNLLHTFLGGLLMFALLYCFARWATKTDPQILRFLLNSAKTRAQYDPMKFAPIPVRGMRHA
jgi:type IV secretory pathway TrbD component